MSSPIHGATLPEGADLRCPDKHFKDEFLVWDPEDRSHACRITVGELARGATDDFLPPEDDAPEELELTPARRTALMARSGAFGR